MKSKLLVVKFKGGLGNQMFQYALYKKLESIGRNVLADLSWFEQHNKEFSLPHVFPKVSLTDEGAIKVISEYKTACKNRGFFYRVLQRLCPLMRYQMNEKDDNVFQPTVLKYKRGILDGYWQTSKYWSDIRGDIRQDFLFSPIKEEKVLELINIIQSFNTVSIHVRRGDYLLPENDRLFGNICTLEYYEKAIEYIKNQYPDIKFVFFTNDAQWVKEQFQMENVFYANDYINDDMPDWYDMHLMSQCNHHIIANSSFSWWGAYLDQKIDKIVIAPSKWLNGKQAKDIYEENWIKI